MPRRTIPSPPATPPLLDPNPGQVAPPLPPAQPTDADHWERIANVTPEEWASSHSAYIYRLWPVIEKKGDAHYICRLRESFDEDRLLDLFGSGKYMCILKNRGAKLATFNVSLHHLNFPPKVSPDEVVPTDPQNERYFKVWGGPEVTATPATPGRPSAAQVDGVAAGLASQLGTITERLMEGNLSGNTPNAQLVELWNKTAAERDQLASKIVELSRVNNVDPLDTLDKIGKVMERFQPKADAAKNPVEQMNDLLKMWGSMKEMFGSAEPAPPQQESIWKHIAPALLPAVAPLSNALAQKLMSMWGGSSDPAASGLKTDAELAAENRAPAATNPSPSGDYSRIVQQLIAMAVNAINQERNGGEFAYAFETLHGNLNYRQLVALGRDNLVTALRSHPTLGQDVLRPQVDLFVDEFLHYGQQPAEESEDDDEDSGQQDRAA